MKKSIFFLSGLPRSGSTLLGSILGQNSKITVTPTSPLLDLLCLNNEAFSKLNSNYTFDAESVSNGVYGAIIDSYYNQFKTDIVFDKHRGWPRNIIPAKMFVSFNPKIICTVRPISEVITSYIKLIINNKQEDNFVDNTLRSKRLHISTENRAKVLWEEYISDPYQSTMHGIKNHPECLHLVKYDDLVKSPIETMEKIYEFIGLDEYKNYNFNKIDNVCAETKDKAWGLDNLHAIRSKLEKTSTDPKEILGEYLSRHYDNFNIV